MSLHAARARARLPRLHGSNPSSAIVVPARSSGVSPAIVCGVRPLAGGLTAVPGTAKGGSGRRASRPLAAAGGGSGVGAGAGGGTGGSGSGGSSGSGDAHPLRNATFAFALLLAAGGAYGYFKKGSAKSLGAGLGAALIFALSARNMVGATAIPSARVAFALSALLGVVMGSRFSNSKKFMPAGLVAVISLGLAAGFVAIGL